MVRDGDDVALYLLLALFCASMIAWSLLTGLPDQIGYSLMITCLLGVFFWYRARIGVPSFVAIALIVHQIFHMSGNFVYVRGVRLYDFWIIPGIFKYDNFTHLLGSCVIMLVFWYALSPRITFVTSHPALALFVMVLMTAGVGTIVEIGELWAVLHLGIADRVGDYVNNAFDLVFNMYGAILGAVIIYVRMSLDGSSVYRRRHGDAKVRR